MYKVLDVSRYDGRQILTTTPYTYAYHPIDWGQAKAQWAGGIVKASQGVGVDPLYAAQVISMKAAGSPYGSYHYFMTSANAIAAASAFCNHVEAFGGYGTMGAWLDAESNPTPISGAAYLASCGSWLNEVHKRMQAAGSTAPLGIYTRKSFFDPLWIAAGSPSWTRTIPAWLAQYSYDASTYFAERYAAVMAGTLVPPKPASAALPLLYGHQWTAKGKPRDVPGYPPYKLSVDFNLWYVVDLAPVPPPVLTLEQRVAALEVRVAVLENR